MKIKKASLVFLLFVIVNTGLYGMHEFDLSSSRKKVEELEERSNKGGFIEYNEILNLKQLLESDKKRLEVDKWPFYPSEPLPIALTVYNVEGKDIRSLRTKEDIEKDLKDITLLMRRLEVLQNKYMGWRLWRYAQPAWRYGMSYLGY